MPVQRGKDNKGAFFRWGTHGKKYYYKAGSVTSRQNARIKAGRQGVAIKISQNRSRGKRSE